MRTECKVGHDLTQPNAVYAADGKCRECVRLRQGRYNAAHREEQRDYHRKYDPLRRGQKAEYRRKYEATHREELARKARARNAKHVAAGLCRSGDGKPLLTTVLCADCMERQNRYNDSFDGYVVRILSAARLGPSRGLARLTQLAGLTDHGNAS